MKLLELNASAVRVELLVDQKRCTCPVPASPLLGFAEYAWVLSYHAAKSFRAVEQARSSDVPGQHHSKSSRVFSVHSPVSCAVGLIVCCWEVVG
eukprot:1559944-Rhodomonas_salina.1